MDSRAHIVALMAIVALAVMVTAPAFAQCNATPAAQDDTAQTYADSLVIDVLANDTDADGDLLEVIVVTETCPGAVTVDEFELVHFTPSSPLTSGCTITYDARDITGATNRATVTVSAASPPNPDVFADDFETGNASRWTSCTPVCP